MTPLHFSDDRRNKPSFRNNDKRPVIGLGCTPEAFLKQKGQHPFQLSVELCDDEPRLSQRPHPPFNAHKHRVTRLQYRQRLVNPLAW